MRFNTDLTHVRLAGMGSVPCLLTAGDGEVALSSMRSVWRQAGAEGRHAQILCTSASAYRIASAQAPPASSIVISPEDLVSVLTASDGGEALKTIIRRQIPAEAPGGPQPHATG